MDKLKSTKTQFGNEICLLGNNTPATERSRTLVIGVFHGDEPQGKFLIEEYLRDNYNPLSPTLSHKGRGSEHKFILEKAKELRKNMTNAERILWEILRAKRFYGFKFKRQAPIGKYIADFVCFERKLIIELDGGQHNTEIQKEHDKIRTLFFENEGYKVIRIWNDEIYKNPEGVLECIEDSLVIIENNKNDSLSPCGRGLERGVNLFIPCLNPDGMQLGKRTNANGVDLNRNFPTQNWEYTARDEFFGGERPASEIETRFVMEIIEEYKPSLILTLHAPFKVVNYDGDAKEISEKISKIINYPVEESIGYPTPGSFGTYAGIENKIPTITLELDETCPVEELISPVHKIFDIL